MANQGENLDVSGNSSGFQTIDLGENIIKRDVKLENNNGELRALKKSKRIEQNSGKKINARSEYNPARQNLGLHR